MIMVGRDEDIKFWDWVLGKLYCFLLGYYDEVIELVFLKNVKGLVERFCSVGIDGIVWVWFLVKVGLDILVEE